MCDNERISALRYEIAITIDPHGHAALMLCESFALLLIEQGVIGKHQVTDAIEGVIEVNREIAMTSKPVVVSVISIILLQDILNSIKAASVSRNLEGQNQAEPKTSLIF